MVSQGRGGTPLGPRQVPQHIGSRSRFVSKLPPTPSSFGARGRSQSSVRPTQTAGAAPPMPTLTVRSLSTGRLRDYSKKSSATNTGSTSQAVAAYNTKATAYNTKATADDPDEVTQAILDLRASRMKKGVKTPRGLIQKSSFHSADSQQENRQSRDGGDHRLQRAEKKIDGLLQELDDLRFLEEIDGADASPPKATPSPKRQQQRTPSSPVQRTPMVHSPVQHARGFIPLPRTNSSAQ